MKTIDAAQPDKSFFLVILPKAIHALYPYMFGMGILLAILMGMIWDQDVRRARQGELNARAAAAHAEESYASRIETLDQKSRQGSSIDIMTQFETTRQAIRAAYRQMAKPALSLNERANYETIALLSKISIQKTVFALHPARANDSWVILLADDWVRFSEKNRGATETLKFDAKFDPRFPALRDRQKSGVPSFSAFLELGVAPPSQTALPLQIRVGRDETQLKLLEASDYELLSIGTPEGEEARKESPLYELRIPMPGVHPGDSRRIEIAVQKVPGTDAKDDSVPFSIYDFQVDRFALGVEKLHVKVEFDSPVWLQSYCVNQQTFDERPCSSDETAFISPPDYKGSSKTTATSFEFERSPANRPVIVLFRQYKPPTEEIQTRVGLAGK